MPSRAIYVEVYVAADIDRVWELTQDPVLHARWDLRFSRITPVEDLAEGGYRFRYERALPLHTIHGTGTSLGERESANGARTSALRFTTDDPVSPLGTGRGYWRYVPTGAGVTFLTGYDYTPTWGATLDRFLVRPFVGWMTAWSFDRLRIWAETGVEPERWTPLSVLAIWLPRRPRASRCSRFPVRGRPMDDAPPALAALEAP
ncbi:SRPBCC family protein [Planctomonas psychrotolerans]|uniref:SRPBCC family protein n=1 Tax=Planctomonas psychrotolerans TaxID=2528712 RepID=UPI00123903CE|nr:SRPBCC family protein [Planctomonas psychrotolerans]